MSLSRSKLNKSVRSEGQFIFSLICTETFVSLQNLKRPKREWPTRKAMTRREQISREKVRRTVGVRSADLRDKSSFVLQERADRTKVESRISRKLKRNSSADRARPNRSNVKTKCSNKCFDRNRRVKNKLNDPIRHRCHSIRWTRVRSTSSRALRAKHKRAEKENAFSMKSSMNSSKERRVSTNCPVQSTRWINRWRISRNSMSVNKSRRIDNSNKHWKSNSLLGNERDELEKRRVFIFFFSICPNKVGRAVLFCKQKVEYFTVKHSIRSTDEFVEQMSSIVKYFYLFILGENKKIEQNTSKTVFIQSWTFKRKNENEKSPWPRSSRIRRSWIEVKQFRQH